MEDTPQTPPTESNGDAKPDVKTEAKPAVEAAPAPPEPKRVSIDDFFEIQLRVARVLQAERIEKTDKLLKLQVDLGSEQRQIVAGLAKSYEPEALIGKHVVVVANLKPARIRGVESQGMLLAADLDGRPIVATFDEEVPPGTRVR
jgi:methionyl-tRNA synthetase